MFPASCVCPSARHYSKIEQLHCARLVVLPSQSPLKPDFAPLCRHSRARAPGGRAASKHVNWMTGHSLIQYSLSICTICARLSNGQERESHDGGEGAYLCRLELVRLRHAASVEDR